LDDINLPTTAHISLYLRVVNASDNGRAKIMSIEPSVSQYSYRYPMAVKGVTRGSKSTRGGRGGRRGGRGGRGARFARKAAMEKGRWWFVVLMVLVQCENGLMIRVHSANLLLLNVCCVCFEKIVVLCGVVELMLLVFKNHLNCVVCVCVCVCVCVRACACACVCVDFLAFVEPVAVEQQAPQQLQQPPPQQQQPVPQRQNTAVAQQQPTKMQQQQRVSCNVYCCCLCCFMVLQIVFRIKLSTHCETQAQNV
jgi:hypothetical protein